MLEVVSYSLFFQLISAVLSVFFLFKKKTLLLKLLSLFLVITFLVEYIGAYYLVVKKNSFWIYYFYTFFEFFMLFVIYKVLIISEKSLKLCKSVLVFFAVLWLVVFYDKTFFYYSIIVGAFMVGLLVFFYLKELLLSNSVVDYKNLFPFWLSVALLVFHLPSIPFFGLISTMKGRSLFPILTSLIILMNIIISFGLIWGNKKEESY